ncbi:MAG: hypothetical protein Q7S96_01625 [bacterium]|nr:hypothetical protein [bacterium]
MRKSWLIVLIVAGVVFLGCSVAGLLKGDNTQYLIGMAVSCSVGVYAWLCVRYPRRTLLGSVLRIPRAVRIAMLVTKFTAAMTALLGSLYFLLRATRCGCEHLDYGDVAVALLCFAITAGTTLSLAEGDLD